MTVNPGSGASPCLADFPFVVGTLVCGDFGKVTCVIKSDGVYFNDIKDTHTSATFNLTKDNKNCTIIVENGNVIDIFYPPNVRDQPAGALPAGQSH